MIEAAASTPVISAAEARAQKSRAFLIGIMMTLLISVTVFAVGTYFFVIPRLYDHEMRLAEVRAWAESHQAAHARDAERAVEPAAVGAVAGDPAGAPAAHEAAP